MPMRRALQGIVLLIAIPLAAAAGQNTTLAPPGPATPVTGSPADAASPPCTAGPDAAAVSGEPQAATPAPANRMAVTFDDLPWVMDRNQAPVDLAAHHARLLAALKLACIPVIGFVNDGKLYEHDTLRRERLRMLEDWLDAGFELGNHTAWHSDLHAVGLEAFQSDILDGERQLRPLLAERGLTPRWFRHPFLRTGRAPEDKAAMDGFLGKHGYRTAPVTINSSEWIYALAYRNVLDDDADAATLAKIRQAYVDYMVSKVGYYERRSMQLLGYRVPQVLLLHVNELNAAAFTDLIARIRARDYRFVGLDEATSDPAYLRPDHYAGELGTSWIHRWAKSENRPETFFFGETATPRWVRQLAGVAAGAE